MTAEETNRGDDATLGDGVETLLNFVDTNDIEDVVSALSVGELFQGLEKAPRSDYW